jgi:hypothetical protein
MHAVRLCRVDSAAPQTSRPMMCLSDCSTDPTRSSSANCAVSDSRNKPIWAKENQQAIKCLQLLHICSASAAQARHVVKFTTPQPCLWAAYSWETTTDHTAGGTLHILVVLWQLSTTASIRQLINHSAADTKCTAVCLCSCTVPNSALQTVLCTE